MNDVMDVTWAARVSRALLLIRILVGWVFVSEGIQKFLFPAQLGVGRFAKIGIPAPHIMAPFVGTVEIVFGTLVVIGLFTRLSTIPLLAVISVAILTTKIPMLAKAGIWSMLHEARTDFSMVLGLVFLLITGAGTLSLDAWRRRKGEAPAATGQARGMSVYTPMTPTNSLTESALFCSAACSSGVSLISRTFSMPFEPSLQGTPTNRPLMPYSPSR